MVYMPLGYPTVKLVLTAIWPLQKPENALHLTGHKDPGTKQILHEKLCPAGMDFMGSNFRDFYVILWSRSLSNSMFHLF